MKKFKGKVLLMLLSILLIVSMVGCGTTETNTGNSFKSGIYTGEATGHNGTVKVEVKLSETEIQSVTVLEHNETPGISDAPIERIPKRIVEQQSLAVDALTGATVTSGAVLKAVENCIEQAGGNVALFKEKKGDNAKVETEEVTYDIVVVGAGAAGTSAALAASEDANVLLLEKTASPMGASTLAGGMFAADSSLQKAAGKTVDKEFIYNKYMKASAGFMNSPLVRTIIDESGSTVDWLIENGCQLNLVDAGTGAGTVHIGMPATLHGYNEGGTVAITKLIERFEQNGGTVMFSAPATELLHDEEGNVSGVMAQKEDGGMLKVNAKVVIIATGGFGGNSEMLKSYYGEDFTTGEIAANIGDGIKMAWEAGAAEFGTAATQYFWSKWTAEESGALYKALGDDFYTLTLFSEYPHLVVNMLGQRFSDESQVTNFARHGAEIAMQPRALKYTIVDSSVLDQIAEHGHVSVQNRFGKWKNDRQFFMEFNEPCDTDTNIARENTPLDLVPLLEGALDTGVVFKGETLEELAKNIGANPETLITSVNQYNQAIKDGHDPAFFADTTHMTPVNEGPYYAVKFVARNLGTLGGVRINEKIEAVNNDGQPIPGLYVAGADAGGMYGRAYVDLEGGTLGFAYTSGRLAGKNALEFIGVK